MTRRPISTPTAFAKVALAAVLTTGAARAETSWPGLRGPDHDGAVRGARLFEGEKAQLALAWKRALGAGYSSVAVGDGKVVTLFTAGDVDVAAAFDADSGSELWRYRIGPTYKGHGGSHDGPIATPLLAGGRVYGLGPWGHLFALDAATGDALWATHLVDDHGAKKPYYGFASNPVIADGVLVVEIGAGEGKAIAGFDADSGELRWSLGDDEIHYHSPIVTTLAGRRQVLAASIETLWGIDPATGEVLWSHPHGGDERGMGGATIIPVPAGDDRILLLNKVDSSVMLQVAAVDGGFEVRELWSGNSLRGTYSHPVAHEGHLYGMSGRIFTCVDAATGEVRWRSREPGDGFPTLVGDQLVVITKPGTLHVIEADPERYRELARLDLFEEHSWSAVAYAGGHLYARSMGELARVEPVAATAGDAEAGRTWIADTVLGRFLAEVDAAADKEAAVDAFLARWGSLPIVEPSGAVHFLYRGEAADVGIVGDVIGARREDPMIRVPGTDLFHYSVRLEPDAAVVYGFIPDYGEVVPDPRNPRTARGAFGEVSFLAMPAWRPPSFGAGTARPGRLETIEWESAVREGQKRTARIYLPAGYDDDLERRYPTVYVYDGGTALEAGGTAAAFDELLGTAAEPLVGVFVVTDPENPRGDLDDLESFSRMIVEELVPRVDGQFRTVAERMARAVAGTANAANAALHTAFRHGELFGKVAAQSAMLLNFEDAEPLVGQADELPLVIYHEWGTYHLRAPHEAWDMGRVNRRLWDLLRERGYRPAGGEVPEGFGWACWKARTDDWLTALFPLPADLPAPIGEPAANAAR